MLCLLQNFTVRYRVHIFTAKCLSFPGICQLSNNTIVTCTVHKTYLKSLGCLRTAASFLLASPSAWRRKPYIPSKHRYFCLWHCNALYRIIHTCYRQTLICFRQSRDPYVRFIKSILCRTWGPYTAACGECRLLGYNVNRRFEGTCCIESSAFHLISSSFAARFILLLSRWRHVPHPKRRVTTPLYMHWTSVPRGCLTQSWQNAAELAGAYLGPRSRVAGHRIRGRSDSASKHTLGFDGKPTGHSSSELLTYIQTRHMLREAWQSEGTVLWDVMPYSLADTNQRFERTCSYHPSIGTSSLFVCCIHCV
jgi:hypothetical protein